MRATMALLLLAGIGPVLRAQEAADGPYAVPDAMTLGRLQARIAGHDRVRVTSGESRLELYGPLLAFDGIRSFGDEEGDRAVLGWWSVERLEVRTPAAVRGLWLGAAIGAGAGLFVGLLAQSPANDGWLWCDGECVGRTTAAGAAGGAVVGLIAGALTRKWTTVYRGRPVAPTVVLDPGGAGPGGGFGLGIRVGP